MQIIMDDIVMLKEKMENLERGQSEMRDTQIGLSSNISENNTNIKLILKRLDIVGRMMETQVIHTERLREGKEDRFNIWQKLNSVKDGMITNKAESGLMTALAMNVPKWIMALLALLVTVAGAVWKFAN
jgi:hypothetical protein